MAKNLLKIQTDELYYSSFRKVQSSKGMKRLSQILLGLFVVILIFMFLPWTQNVQGKGVLTTLKPEQRPQSINSAIGGSVEKWYVIEGQHVHSGDTLLKLAEYKNDYFDPEFVERTKEQVDAKTSSVSSYEEKVNSLKNQLASIKSEYQLKLEMARNKVLQSIDKVQSDSAQLIASTVKIGIEKIRFTRVDSLFRMGFKSRKDYEEGKLKLQEAENKYVSSENKLNIAKNELVNDKIYLDNLKNEYTNKISKSESDLYSAESLLYEAKAQVAKLNNQLVNYTIRKENYYVFAHQDGYIAKIHNPGTGDIIKEGNAVVDIVPKNIDLVATMYIRPVDLPLVKDGERVRLMFDGWPALVLSGWPSASFGTFGGEVMAIDKNISANGKYRILVIPDEKDIPWPEQLKVGAGTSGVLLLNTVPVWWEMWRQINGFPPDFYDGKKSDFPLDKEIDKKYHGE